MGASDSLRIRLTHVVEMRVKFFRLDGLDTERRKWKIEWKARLLAGRFALRRLRRHVVVTHGDVDVLENFSRRDADHAFGGFDEIVAFASGVLAAERIDEAEVRVELLRFDQEASAVRLPLH